MSADFDPYRKWLGIPPEDQPPNHYRLLGLGLFESDIDAISNAADRQMSHVRTFQSGPHSALSQKLLNELSAARVCLLNPASKAEYDRGLRSRVSASAAPNPPPSYAPAPRSLGSPGRPRSSSASAALGEYGLSPTNTLSHPKLRRTARPQTAARTAQIGAAAAAAALVFLAAVYTLTKFGASPQPDSVADVRGNGDSSSVDDEPPKAEANKSTGPSENDSPRVVPETASSTEHHNHDERVERPEILQTNTQPFADLTRKLNDFASWKVLNGQWSQRDGGFVGKGDSRLEFIAELPADCRLSFEMNVLEGMRPRIFLFGERNFHFGNEGYEHTLFIHGDGYEGAVGKPRPYANGETLEIECDFAGRAVQLAVNGQLVVRALSKHAGPLQLTISGGDFYSPGQTLFRNFKLDPAPAESDGLAMGSVDLLKGIEPKRDAVLGDWSFEGDALLTSPLECARMQIPYEPPADYELRITAQSKTQDNGALFIGLVVGGRQTSVAMDGWDKQTSGMHMLDGMPAGFNSSKRQGRVFTDGEPKEIVCTVHPTSVLARCGDQTIVDWRGDPAKLSMEQRLEVPNQRQLFLAGWDGRFLITKLELKPLPPEPTPGAPTANPTGKPSERPAPDAREPVPDPALVREAGRKVEAKYQNDWRRAKKLADRLGIPLRMIDDSRGAESMPMRYALLREAADRAAGLGDAGAICEAFDELEKHFRVDALDDRLEAVRQSVRKLHDSSQAWTAIMSALSLADLALRADHPGLADGFLESAALAAKKSGNLAVQQVIRERTAAVARRKREREKCEEARQRLKSAPEDAAANLAVGRYECFYLGRWEQGLPRLEKSSDATLAKLGELEKTAAADPSQRATLAEAWQAAAAQAGADQDDYLLEANYWRLRSLAKPAIQPGAAAGIGLARAEPGLNAMLFNGADFQQEVLCRVDPFIRKNFGFGSPDPKIGGDFFSIRWTGWLNPPLAGKYVLHAAADDGFRLWLDGKKLLDRWGGAGDESKEVEFTVGLHALKIEYNEYGATAGVRLSWQLRDLSTDFTVPGAVLFHDSAGISESLEAQ